MMISENFFVFVTCWTWKMREFTQFFFKFGRNSLTGQKGFDWSTIQKVWLVNDWLTSHKVSTLVIRACKTAWYPQKSTISIEWWNSHNFKDFLLCYSGSYRATRWVFGGKCPEDNIGFMVPVPNRARATLEPLIIRNIQPGSMIHHDCWAAYDRWVSLRYDTYFCAEFKNYNPFAI